MLLFFPSALLVVRIVVGLGQDFTVHISVYGKVPSLLQLVIGVVAVVLHDPTPSHYLRQWSVIHQFKATERKAFLDLYGPVLMYNHIPDDAHANLCLLNDIWMRATQRNITHDDIDFIERSAIEFVREYERIYNHGDPQRMPACSINNHWLLDLADYIQDNGPACYWWSYPMECFCGWVREMATSKAHMGKSIANNQTRDEQINALRLRDYRGYIHPDRTPQHQYLSLHGPLRDPTGQLTEVDCIDRRGRFTMMILGALHEVWLAGGINPADLRR